ncbi:FtsW/RodA/SpoVE family cell cycle protein [Terribacillus sp. JSM ZJ617]|uniref:FtsW/RodA/SpoVE family cell cycle protein n=1 Tax=Terribacillus sp. JSM ZJ617 TaxID=3342119 RepID=UPI0035A83AFE
MDKFRYFLKNIDYTYLAIIVAFALVSLISLYHVNELQNENFVPKQTAFYIIGFIMFFLITYAVDIDILKRVSLYIYILCFILLFGILVAPSSISTEINKALGWYSVGGFSFQPAELMKVGLIIQLASIISRSNENTQSVSNEFILILKLILTTALPTLVVMRFPDYGNAMVFLAILAIMLIVSNIRVKVLAAIFALPLLIIGTLALTYFIAPDFFLDKILGLLPGYQASRFYGWLDPETYTISGYQLNQSIMSIGAGGLIGYEKLPSIPYAYSDLIFAIIGGVYGFVGTSIVIFLYFLMIYKIISISQRYHDDFGTYIGVGIAGFLTFQVFQNAGMSVGLMPVTGIGLPLISYGGSALVITLMALGLVMCIKANTLTLSFSSQSNR